MTSSSTCALDPPFRFAPAQVSTDVLDLMGPNHEAELVPGHAGSLRRVVSITCASDKKNMQQCPEQELKQLEAYTPVIHHGWREFGTLKA